MESMRIHPLAALAALPAAALWAAPGSRPSPTPLPPPQELQAVMVALRPPARPLPELEAALGSADATVRADAAWELSGAGSISESIGNRLKAALKEDPDARVRAAAAWAYGHVHQGLGPADGSLQPVPYDEPPRLVQQARVTYPQAAFEQRVTGTVRVEFVVDEEGRVAHAEVRESIPAFDAAALAAVREWRFSPATLAGKPIATMASAPVAFTIAGKD
jgi:protein TonB